MNYQDWSKPELIAELLKLELENSGLRLSRGGNVALNLSPDDHNDQKQIDFSVTREVTEYKKAEASLVESEEKFRSLYANMIDGSALHTLIYNDQGDPEDYLIIEVNPAFEILLGISRDTVINKTSREAYGVDNPPYFEIYSKVALSGKPEVFETYFAPLDKSFSISVYCPYKGSFATIFKNISERKKSEQELRIVLTKYQVLFDTFPIGITITDGAGNIIESNPIAETLLGISNEEQVKRTIGGQEWRIIKSDGAPMLPSEFASVRALEQGQQVTNMEMGIVKEDNQTTWLNVSATPIPLEGYGVAIVYNDITLRKLAERENERKQKLLEDSQRIGKIGGWEVNIDTQELKWTQEMYNIHEVDSTFFKPKVDQRFNFYTTETLPLVDKAMRQAIEQGGSYEVDSEIHLVQ
jgi:PAS domain S-box-containing protein